MDMAASGDRAARLCTLRLDALLKTSVSSTNGHGWGGKVRTHTDDDLGAEEVGALPGEPPGGAPGAAVVHVLDQHEGQRAEQVEPLHHVLRGVMMGLIVRSMANLATFGLFMFDSFDHGNPQQSTFQTHLSLHTILP